MTYEQIKNARQQFLNSTEAKNQTLRKKWQQAIKMLNAEMKYTSEVPQRLVNTFRNLGV